MGFNRSLNIAIFTETYLPQINGVVTSTLTFVEELEKLGHSVLVVGPKMKGAKESSEKVWRFRSIPYPFQNEHRVIWPISRKLRQFKDMRFDVIHIQTPFSMGHLGQYLGWKYHIPVVHTYHTYWYEYLHYFPLLPAKLRKKADLLLFTKKFCERCDHVIVPSSQMRDKLLLDHVQVPLTVIPTGIDVSRSVSHDDTVAFKQKCGISDSDHVMIFVGRLGKEKNVYFLLDAFCKILQHVPTAKLLIVGDGPEREKMEAFSKKHGFSQSVVFTGYLSHDEVFVAYSASRIIVFPSKTETQGLSLLEGLSLGKPAVCIGAMGVQDILAHNEGGFLTQDDVSEFSSCVLKLIYDESLYHTKSQEAKSRAMQFSSFRMAERLVEVYEEVIETNLVRGKR
jgi:glycosyltransferase involved in cell wall biosynthesis